MPTYLVETYLPRGQEHELTAFESIRVPGDEICFYVFDAPSAREAERAAQRAGLDPIRVVEAVSSTAARAPTDTEKEEP